MSQEDFLLNDEEDDAFLANHLEDLENGFDFVLTPHIDQRVCRLGVHHRNYTARLVQRGGGGPLMPQHRPLPIDSKMLFNVPFDLKSSRTQKFNRRIIYS